MNPNLVKRFPDYYEAEPRETYTYTNEKGNTSIVFTRYRFGVLARCPAQRRRSRIKDSRLYFRSFSDDICLFEFLWEQRGDDRSAFSPDSFQCNLPAEYEKAARAYLKKVFPHSEPRWVGVHYCAAAPPELVRTYIDLRLTPKW